MKPAAIATGALVTASVMVASIPLSASPQDWPWKTKTPVDPALALLTKVDDVSVTMAPEEQAELRISVKATAPAAGYSELQLTARLGDPEDLVFSFDARGRPPQDRTKDAPTSVKIDAAYANVPSARIRVIEVNAKENCIAYSLADKTRVDCLPKLPQVQ